MLPIKRIVCPTDFSEPSYVGLKAANGFAEHFSAELLLVHVVTPIHVYPAPQGGGVDLEAYVQRMVHSARISLAEVVKERVLPDLTVRTFVLQGNAADEIVDLAESKEADVIVTATHGLSGWRRFIFGSVAGKLVRLAACPVLTVPAPE